MRFDVTKIIRDLQGSTAIVFALSALPITLAIGVTVDYSQALRARTVLQASADAAALAGVGEGIDDNDREGQMESYFQASAPANLVQLISSSDYVHEPSDNSSHVTITADVPNSFLTLIGKTATTVHVEARAKAEPIRPRLLDVVMCIDATGSMQTTINSIRGRALNFESDLNRELDRRDMAEFDEIRMKVIVYRDYGGNNQSAGSNYYHVSSGGDVDKHPHGFEWRPAGNARNYGDDEPMVVSNYFNLPQDSSGFRIFLQGENASGGGDYPESGLECVNEAINADWLQVGDPMPVSGSAIQQVYPMIVVWTDIDAHPPSFFWSLENPDYPAAADMPRTYSGLEAKWNDPNRIKQENKLLVTFMPNGINTPEWDNLTSWQGYFRGGTLQDGNSRMFEHFADALESMPQYKSTALTK